MKRNFGYFLYLTTLHLIIGALLFVMLRKQPVWFIALEAVLAGSWLIGLGMHARFNRPLRLLLAGVEALRDQDFSITLRPSGHPATDQLVHVYNGMIGQLRRERIQLTEQQFFLEKLLQALPIGVLVLDFEGRVVNANTRALEMLQLQGQSWQKAPLFSLIHPLVPQLSALQGDTTRLVQINGTEKYKLTQAHFMDRGHPRPFLLLEELSAELLAHEKMAYDKVIRLMAHEVNNSIGPVNSILATTQRLLHQQGLANFAAALEVAIARNERLNHFMQRFAAVVRVPAPQLEWIPLTQLLTRIEPILAALATTSDLGWTLRLPEASPAIWVDVEQLEQVLVNIVKNAVEACQPGQQIVLEAHPDGLLVRNNGQPITPELAQQMFTPFFSSKPTGQGIGLALIREILHQHGWRWQLATRADGWTVFQIWWK